MSKPMTPKIADDFDQWEIIKLDDQLVADEEERLTGEMYRESGGSGKARINTAAIYARFNRRRRGK